MASGFVCNCCMNIFCYLFVTVVIYQYRFSESPKTRPGYYAFKKVQKAYKQRVRHHGDHKYLNANGNDRSRDALVGYCLHQVVCF